MNMLTVLGGECAESRVVVSSGFDSVLCRELAGEVLSAPS